MYDKDKYEKAIKKGDEAEKKFVKLAEANGYTISKSSKHNDIMHHYDYIIECPFVKIRVDVKAKKEGFENMFLIEHKGVSGKQGWLWGSADVIAFEYKEGFIMVRRRDLALKCMQLINLEQKSTPTQKDKVPYVVYDREKYGNHDRFFYITEADLLDMNYIILEL